MAFFQILVLKGLDFGDHRDLVCAGYNGFFDIIDQVGDPFFDKLIQLLQLTGLLGVVVVEKGLQIVEKAGLDMGKLALEISQLFQED